MLHDAKLAAEMAARIRARGVRGGLFLPGGAAGQARIRTQMSAALTREDLDRAVAAFVAARDAIAG
jgi:glycine C-acetyltransferase